MRRTMQGLAVMGMVAMGVLLRGGMASADSGPSYRQAMGPLLGEVWAWTGEAEVLIGAASTKPELACGAEMSTLSQRGLWLTQDLAGTGASAPAGLLADHETLTLRVLDLTVLTRASCGDPLAVAAAFAPQMAMSRVAARPIEVHLAGLHMERPGHVPVGPGAGN